MLQRNPFLWICRVVAAIILLQTLFFKFSAAPESVYIFSAVGMEPYGRIATGVIELVSAILILLPRYSLYGAFLAILIMLGAIGSHLFVLGIEVMNDGGQLFIYAVLVLICSLIIVYAYTKRAKKP
jgi:uncharacterized membrane protein YphA (DoxX/SURF4 family)